MQPSSPIVIGVVGGGIGGIALALALRQQGIEVKVFEGDSSFDSRRQGYGLTMQQAGHAIRALGIELKEEAPSKSHYVFSSDGRIVGFFGRAFRSGNCDENRDKAPPKKKDKPARWQPSPKIRFNIHIPRQVLREILMNKIDIGVIQWGRKLLKYCEIPPQTLPGVNEIGGVMLHFHDGTQEFVTALVGADGIHSAVRRQKVGDDLRYLGVIVILGIVKSSHPMVHERIFETVDGTTRIYVMPFTSDVSMWQLSFPCEEDYAKSISVDPSLLRAEALKRCCTWHAPVPSLLSDTSLDLICGYPVYDRQPLCASDLRKDAGSLVTLLGDAAHPMSPFRGQGANQALLDAVLLAQCIRDALTASGPGGIAHGLSTYEESMLERTRSKVMGSREAAYALHSEAVQGVAQQVEVGGQVLPAQAMIEELHRAGVGAWTSESAQGIDAEVRRVTGRVPSGCPSALHLDKMLRGRLIAPPPPRQPKEPKAKHRLPRPVPVRPNDQTWDGSDGLGVGEGVEVARQVEAVEEGEASRLGECDGYTLEW